MESEDLIRRCTLRHTALTYSHLDFRSQGVGPEPREIQVTVSLGVEHTVAGLDEDATRLTRFLVEMRGKLRLALQDAPEGAGDTEILSVEAAFRGLYSVSEGEPVSIDEAQALGPWFATQIYPFLSEHINYMLFHTGLSSAAVRIPPALDFFPATQTPSTQRDQVS